MSKTSPMQTSDQLLILRRLRTSMLLISLPFGVLMFMLPIIGRQMGASALEIGGLYSIFSLMTVLLRPVVGQALDRFGRKPFLLAGLAAYGLANVLYALADSVALLYLARMVQGIGSGLTWLTAYAIVADTAGSEERGGRFGQVDEMSSRGGIIGVFIIFTLMGFLGDSQGWTTGFYVFTAIGLIGLGFAWARIPETRSVSEERPVSTPADARSHRAALREVISFPFATLMGIVFLTASAYALTSPILMLYLRDHVSDSIMALAWAFFPSALIYAMLPSKLGRLSDRWDRRLPMAVALIVAGIVSITIPQVRSLWPLVFLWAAETVCFAAANPTEEALVADLSPDEHRGLAYGIYTAASSLGFVMGPLLGGWLYGAFGERYPFLANAGLLWLGALGVLLVLRIPDRVKRTAIESREAGS